MADDFLGQNWDRQDADKMLEIIMKIGNEKRKQEEISGNTDRILREQVINTEKQLDILKKHYGLSEKEAKSYINQLKSNQELVKNFQMQKRAKETMVSLLKQEGEVLRQNGKHALAYFKDLQAWRKEIGKAGQIGFAGQKTNEVLKSATTDPIGGMREAGQKGITKGAEIFGGANAAAAAGPWAMVLSELVKIFIEMLDVTRHVESDFRKASASMGKFGKDLVEWNTLSSDIVKNQAELTTKFGMDAKEFSQAFGSIIKTGAFGEISKKFEDAKESVSGLLTVSMTTGRSIDEVSSSLAVQKREFTSFGKTFNDIMNDQMAVSGFASKVAQTGIMTSNSFIKTIESLGSQFGDLNLNFVKTGSLVGYFTVGLSKLGVTASTMGKITNELVGSIKNTSEGWKALIGSLSGFNKGGYTSALFGAEQRGAGGNLLGRSFDTSTWLKQVMGVLNKATTGMSPANRQLMTEKLGKNMGLSEQTVQSMQKLLGGGLSASQAQKEIKNMAEEAEKTNQLSKDLNDLLKQLIMGWIYKPLMAIWSVLKEIGAFFGAGNTESRNRAALNEGAFKSQNELANVYDPNRSNGNRNDINNAAKTMNNRQNRNSTQRSSYKTNTQVVETALGKARVKIDFETNDSIVKQNQLAPAIG